MIDARTLQLMVDLAAARQHQSDDVMRYQNAGDLESARFLDRPLDQQHHLLSRQAARDMGEALDRDDQPAASAAIREMMRHGTRQPRQRRRT